MRYLKLCICFLLLTPVLSNCKTAESKKTNESDTTTVPPVAESLAPGTLRAIIMITDVTDTQLVTASVKEVLGYGSATDPVSVNTQIQFNVPSSLSSDKKALIKKDASLTAELRRPQSMKIGNSTTSNLWQLITVK